MRPDVAAPHRQEPKLLPWLIAHDFSSTDEPMVKLPAGRRTISGQARQSRKTAPAARGAAVACANGVRRSSDATGERQNDA